MTQRTCEPYFVADKNNSGSHWAHDPKCYEVGLTTFISGSTAVSVVKHSDPFQLICPFDTSTMLTFFGVDSRTAMQRRGAAI